MLFGLAIDAKYIGAARKRAERLVIWTRSLPTGSQLTDGHFTWAPPVGHVGAYDLHVWAHRRDAGAAPTFLGAADLNAWRPDVGAQLGAQFERAGWSLTVPALPPVEYDVVAYFWSAKTQRFEDARVVRVSVR